MEAYRRGWGFDLEWDVRAGEVGGYDEAAVQAKMEACIDAFAAGALEEEREGGAVSATQEKKRAKEAQKTKQRARARARLAASREG